VGPKDLDARLELSGTEAVRGDAFPYRIVNTGTARLICGVGYVLERAAGQEWEVMNPPGMYFPAIGLIVEPGDERQLRASIPPDALSGQYRIRTSVHCEPPPTPTRSVEISARFHIP
jgi:hypothetical protein